jgi:hypothetical protein
MVLFIFYPAKGHQTIRPCSLLYREYHIMVYKGDAVYVGKKRIKNKVQGNALIM